MPTLISQVLDCPIHALQVHVGLLVADLAGKAGHIRKVMRSKVLF